ncbi:MAG TPA: CoA ester lyase [Herbaspirillum sp.]|jgi:citrate lyase subunit beta/citryl-CoA lyase
MTYFQPVERPARRRRVQLAVPAISEKMMAKAAASNADHIFLDLEDSVAPKEKVNARAKAIHALKTLDWGDKTRCVRINDLGTEWAYEDIIQVVEQAHDKLDTIMLPKARQASDLLFVDTLLNQIEKKLKLTKRIGLEVLIEEVDGMRNINEIAFATPRLEALIFGVGDYSASQGIDPVILYGKSAYPGDPWHYGRWQVLIAARSAGVDAIDGPFPGIKDTDGYRTDCINGQLLGFNGKWALHPAQIDIALECFTPDREAVIKARAMVAAYAKAEADGLGSIAVDGQMVDAATVRMVQVLLRRAEQAGM